MYELCQLLMLNAAPLYRFFPTDDKTFTPWSSTFSLLQYFHFCSQIWITSEITPRFVTDFVSLYHN